MSESSESQQPHEALNNASHTETLAQKDKTIGQVLSALDVDFPGISASKIRFLEDKGLVHPQRTNTGYRKYSVQDIEQLRYILTLQREQYLPLRVIKEKIENGDFGATANTSHTQHGKTAEAQDHAPTSAEVSQPSVEVAPVAHELEGIEDSGNTYSLRELSAATGADLPLLRELINFGLIRDTDGVYDDYDVVITKVCSQLTAHGLQPRHLRQFRAAADREVGLVETAIAPLASRKDSESRAKAAARASEIAQLNLRLHMALVASSMPEF